MDLDLPHLNDLLRLFTPSYLPIDVNSWYRKHVYVTREESDRLALAEQGSEEWLQIRKNRCSGSRAAIAVGLSKDAKNIRQACNQFLWDTFEGNMFTAWGSKHEISAQTMCEEVMREHYTPLGGSIQFEYPGGIIIEGHEWFVASVDGVAFLHDEHGNIKEAIVLEFKCPFRALYAEPKATHIVQFTMYMGMLRLHNPQKYGTIKRCIYGVWTPEKMEFYEFPFDEGYFRELLAINRFFYFQELLPRFILKDLGMLQFKQYKLLAPAHNALAQNVDDTPTANKGARKKSNPKPKAKAKAKAKFQPLSASCLSFLGNVQLADNVTSVLGKQEKSPPWPRLMGPKPKFEQITPPHQKACSDRVQESWPRMLGPKPRYEQISPPLSPQRTPAARPRVKRSLEDMLASAEQTISAEAKTKAQQQQQVEQADAALTIPEPIKKRPRLSSIVKS
jgi:hypothetical protein